MALQRAKIHRAGIRPHLFLGGDRELVLFTALIAFVLSVPSFQWVSIATGIVLWLIALFLLRQLAKADPRMRHVYLRQLRYRRYYPARSRPYRDNRTTQGSAFAGRKNK
jgi:type IV secretory pathway TrbD component